MRTAPTDTNVQNAFSYHCVMRARTIDDDVFADRPDLSEASDLPAHARITYWLERLITSRRLQPGEKLPSEVEIAQALEISRMTLRQALATIESKGLIERRRGRFGGNFVSQPRFEYHLSGLPGFTEQMRLAHVEAGAQVVSASTKRPSAEVRTQLQLKQGERVHEVVRVRSANGEPIGLEMAYLPATLFPALLQLNLTDSIYRLMTSQYNRTPTTAEEVVEPVKATALQAELLQIAEDDLLQLVTRTSYDQQGQPVECSFDYFRPDRTRIRMRTRSSDGFTPNVTVEDTSQGQQH